MWCVSVTTTRSKARTASFNFTYLLTAVALPRNAASRLDGIDSAADHLNHAIALDARFWPALVEKARLSAATGDWEQVMTGPHELPFRHEHASAGLHCLWVLHRNCLNPCPTDACVGFMTVRISRRGIPRRHEEGRVVSRPGGDGLKRSQMPAVSVHTSYSFRHGCYKHCRSGFRWVQMLLRHLCAGCHVKSIVDV